MSEQAAKRRRVETERIKVEKKTNRIFHDEWRTEYFMELIGGKAMCLICRESLNAIKEYNCRRHYEAKHANAFGDLSGELRMIKFTQLKNGLSAQQNVFTKQTQDIQSVTRQHGFWTSCGRHNDVTSQ